MQALIDAYVTLIMVKRRTIDNVLPHLQDKVLKDLEAMGLDGYGNPIEP